MAKFTFNGMDEISASFEQLSRISDDDKISVIMPAAKLLARRQSEKIIEMFAQRTGDLAKSLAVSIKNGAEGSYAYIYLKGKHRGSGTGKRKKRDKNGKIIVSGKYSGTNAEVGYILNFGSPRISATHWLDNANDEAEDEVNDALQSSWDDLITRKGL